MKRKCVAFLLLTALLLTACGSGEKTLPDPTEQPTAAPVQTQTPAPAPEETATPEDRAPFVTVFMDTEAETHGSDGAVVLYYAADRPKVEIPQRPQAAAAVNAVLEADYTRFRDGEENRDYASGVEDYLAAAGEELSWRQQENSMDSFTPYELRRQVHVVRADAGVISVVAVETTFMGGVHGYAGRSARNFDAQTGAVLQLEDLAEDPQAFLTLCADLLWTASRGGDNAFLAVGEGYFDGYEKDLPDLLRDGNWYLDDKGLVIIANPYEVAPYAAGGISFVLPYDALRSDMKKEYLPAEAAAEGTITGEILPDAVESSFYLDDDTEDRGACVFLLAEGDVRDVRIVRVGYNEWNNTFTETADFWAVSDLPAGTTVLLRTWIGDVLPTFKLSYVSAGEKREYYISQSGKDGSLVLLDGRQFPDLPAEITRMLPFSRDVDGDSVPEVIDMADTGEENYRRLTVDGEPLGDVFSSSPDLWHLWLTDLDSDGREELLYCADMGSDDYVTSAWRADTLEPIRFTGETRGGKDGKEMTDTANGKIVFSYGSLFLESCTCQLGTYASLRPYELLSDGVIAPCSGENQWGHGDWEFVYNRQYLELTREIPVSVVGSGEGTLPAGARILLLGTDGTRLRFCTEDGLTGTFLAEYRDGEDRGWFINGTKDTDCFASLPYAG